MRLLICLLFLGCGRTEFNHSGVYECWNDSFQVTFDTADAEAYFDKIIAIDMETGGEFTLEASDTSVICSKITRPSIYAYDGVIEVSR